MSHHKLIVIRSDGISHETEISGWHAETVMLDLMRQHREDKRTVFFAWFDGVKSDHSANIVWHLRSIDERRNPNDR